MRLSDRGAVSLPVVIAVVLGLGFASSAALNVIQFTRSDQDKKLLTGEITDLRYQLGQDKLATNATPSPSPTTSPDTTPSPAPSASPTPTPAVLGDTTAAKTATIKVSRNAHSTIDPKSSISIPYTQLTIGKSITLDGAATNGYQKISFNGKTGYILASYLQY